MSTGQERLLYAESRGMSGHDNFIRLVYEQGEFHENQVSECKQAHLTTLLASSDCVKRGDPRALFQYVREHHCRPGVATCLKVVHAGFLGTFDPMVSW